MALLPTTIAVVVSEMLETVLYASIAGIGIAIVFSCAIVGLTKSVDYARDERRTAAIAAGTLGIMALVTCLAGVGFGLYIMAAD